MPLQFIELREPEAGRVSSLSYGGNRDDGMLRVIGGLNHNAGIVPKTTADADKLIAWLQRWKEQQTLVFIHDATGTVFWMQNGALYAAPLHRAPGSCTKFDFSEAAEVEPNPETDEAVRLAREALTR